jgi:hypothetical protein
VTEILNDGSAKTISDARNTPFLHDINFLGVKDQLNTLTAGLFSDVTLS